MKYNTLQFYTLLLLISIITGCTKVKVDFKINGKDRISPSNVQPAKEDSTKIIEVWKGEEVYLTDNSSPNNRINTRYWDTNGDGAFENILPNSEHFPTIFEEEGFHKVTLCINSNNEENCVTKWVYVKEGIPDEIDHFIIPDFSDYPKETEERKFKIEVHTVDISNKEELRVLLNGKEKNTFSFDPDNEILTFDPSLKKGSNTIDFIADLEDGSKSKQIEIIYTPEDNKPISPDLILDNSGVTNPKDEQVGDNESTTAIEPTNYSDTSSSTEINESEPTKDIPELTKYDDTGIGVDPGTVSKHDVKVDKGSFSITPNKFVKIISLKVEADNCGGIRIKKSSEKGREKQEQYALTPGVNGINISELKAILEPGIKYTFFYETFAPFNGCGDAPPLLVGDSDAKKNTTKRFSLDLNNKPVFFNLQYQYQDENDQ